MRSKFILLAIPALLLAASCAEKSGQAVAVDQANKPAQTANGPASTPIAAQYPTPGQAAADRISLADAKKAFDDGSAVFVDVRDSSSFKLERVKGALNIPITELAANADKLPKGKKIIVYCS